MEHALQVHCYQVGRRPSVAIMQVIAAANARIGHNGIQPLGALGKGSHSWGRGFAVAHVQLIGQRDAALKLHQPCQLP